MPFEAPVTTATLPLSLLMIFLLCCRFDGSMNVEIWSDRRSARGGWARCEKCHTGAVVVVRCSTGGALPPREGGRRGGGVNTNLRPPTRRVSRGDLPLSGGGKVA